MVPHNQPGTIPLPVPKSEATAETFPVPQNNYQRIKQEIDSGNVKEEVWIEAYAKGRGNYTKAVSIYITLRADQLYKENTSFFKRTGHTVAKQFDPNDQRGLKVLIASIVGLLAISLFGAQPFLRSNASKKYLAWCAKARDLSLTGKNQTFLLQNFGTPAEIVTTGGSVTYFYNPCSFFCFNKERFQFKVTVDAASAKVSGWEWNAAFNAPDSP